MSKSNTAKKAAPALRVIQATGKPGPARLEQLQAYIKAMESARAAGLDIEIQVHVGAVTVELSNFANGGSIGARPYLVGEAAPEQLAPRPRFTKVSKDGKALPETAAEWEGVYDANQGLIWGRTTLPGEHNWKDACKKAGEATLCAAPARAPTAQERFALNDLSKHGPALDTAFFAKDSGWEWTSTVDAESPSGFAWVVNLGNGRAYRFNQDDRGHVRAVRSGQPIGL